MSELLAVQTDGSHRFVSTGYESIKAGLNGATLDFIRGGRIGAYIDDEGMLNGSPLNVPASLMFGIVLYGPVVLCAGDPDEEGETVAPPDDAVGVLVGLAEQWERVVADAARKGQRLEIAANSGSIPPPTVVGFTDEQFSRFLETGEFPQ